jgi:hypothetical protein
MGSGRGEYVRDALSQLRTSHSFLRLIGGGPVLVLPSSGPTDQQDRPEFSFFGSRFSHLSPFRVVCHRSSMSVLCFAQVSLVAAG